MFRFIPLRLHGIVRPALLLTVLAGCADSPVAPPTAAQPGPAALSAAVVSKGTGAFSVDDYGYWECAGEVVHNVFSASLRYSTVTNGQGTVYRELWYSQQGIGTITGMTSGTVWTRDVTASPFVFRDLGGGMVASVYRGRFTSETGPTLFVREVFHTSTNANGEVVVDRYEFTCDVGRNPD